MRWRGSQSTSCGADERVDWLDRHIAISRSLLMVKRGSPSISVQADVRRGAVPGSCVALQALESC